MANKTLEELLFELERQRLWVTLLITIVGLAIAVGVIFILKGFATTDSAGIVTYMPPEGIASIVGLFTTVLGTIVGAFLGLQFGLSEKAKNDAVRLNNTKVALEAIAKLSQTESVAGEDLAKRLL
jgi:hypothetical protein